MNNFTEPIYIDRKNRKLVVRVYLHAPECVCVYTENCLSEDSYLLRVHSSCLFSEAFGADDCDCGIQLSGFLDALEGREGMLIYSYEEGRGIGLQAKCEAIAIEQSQGVNSAEAFSKLGYPPDKRDLSTAIHVLQKIGAPNNINLLTNNPLKIKALERAGYTVSRASIKINNTAKQERYLNGKQQFLGHLRED